MELKSIIFRAVAFVPGGDNWGQGFYFFNLTLHEAILEMNELGIDVINDKKNWKYNIKVYYQFK